MKYRVIHKAVGDNPNIRDFQGPFTYIRQQRVRPVSFSMKLRRIGKKIDEAYAHIVEERGLIIDDLSEDGVISPNDPQMIEFLNRFDEVLDAEFDFRSEKIKISDLESSAIPLSEADLDVLDFILEYDNDAEHQREDTG